MPAVQVFHELLLPGGGPHSVHPHSKDWRTVHVLGSTGKTTGCYGVAVDKPWMLGMPELVSHLLLALASVRWERTLNFVL